MIRRYAVGALVASTLVAAWPAEAAAKGVPRSVGLCGPSACVHVSDRALRLAVAHTEGRPPRPPPRLAPYLRLTRRPSAFGLSGYLVPSQGVLVLGAVTYRVGRAPSHSPGRGRRGSRPTGPGSRGSGSGAGPRSIHPGTRRSCGGPS
jgi:hypothetical protein